MMYRMKRNLENAIANELGSMVNDDTRWTQEEVNADAESFNMTPDEFIDRYLEECEIDLEAEIKRLQKDVDSLRDMRKNFFQKEA